MTAEKPVEATARAEQESLTRQKELDEAAALLEKMQQGQSSGTEAAPTEIKQENSEVVPVESSQDRFDKGEFTLEDVKDRYNEKDYSTILRAASSTDNFKEERFGKEFIEIKDNILNTLMQQVESARAAYKRDIEADPHASDAEKKDIMWEHLGPISNVIGILQGANIYDEKVKEIITLTKKPIDKE